MGLLDFDLDKVLQNPAFMLGMNIHGANTGNYGQLGPALSGGMNNYQRQRMMQQSINNPGTPEYGTTVQFDREGNSYIIGKDGSVKKLPQKFVKPMTIKDFGPYFGGVNPITGNASVIGNKGLSPSQTPEYKRSIKEVEAKATSDASNKALLQEMESMLPKLEGTVSHLKNLAKTATYTTAGKAYDWTMREIGADVPQGAVDRAEFQSTIDNNVLPLLRQTFGAAFTAEEGNRLRATMGDADLSPQEKLAQLEAFINNKRAEVERYRMLTGKTVRPGSFDELWGE